MNKIEKGWLFKSWKEKGWKPTWEQLKYNYVMLDSHEAQLKKQMYSHVVTFIGLLVVCGYLIYSRRWWFIIASGGTTFVFYYQLKGVWRQLQTYRDMQKQAEKLTEQLSVGGRDGLQS